MVDLHQNRGKDNFDVQSVLTKAQKKRSSLSLSREREREREIAERIPVQCSAHLLLLFSCIYSKKQKYK